MAFFITGLNTLNLPQKNLVQKEKRAKMAVLISFRQETPWLKKRKVKKNLAKVLKDLGYNDNELSILFTNDHHIAQLNSYYLATDPAKDPRKIEDNYIEVLNAVKNAVTIPVALKLSPYFTSLSHMATRFDEIRVDALVLFNRFYQPDIDLDNLEVVPNLVLSTSESMRVPLRWIAILYGKVKASLAATSGIHTAEDVLKMIMAGADITQLCATLLRNGVGRITEIQDGMIKWMEDHEYESVKQMKGSMSHKSVAEPAAFERANYMRVLKSYQ